ncbi:hypothetical protein AMS68_003537 [Peltaster fructicola]|uniref:Translation initiation factor eIF2B subunit gamma n=1 Tax=Peltaster fructicola TaxID=286661 RepID=A0A6H0XU93_9PEZI|nr:hypothetical protein AMS68_003537 [Peltaster fructicola]
MPHATHPSPGLQALVLCGPGVSLNTFTSIPEEFPKALVPIANRPMVWYAIDWCHRMGITDITLITPPESAAALESALKINPALTSLPSPKPEILAPEDVTLTTGTAEILRSKRVQDCITSDFVVLPCDLISELDGSRVIEQWLSLNLFSPDSASSASSKGGLAIYYPTQGLEGISMKKDETDFMATAPLVRPTVPPPSGSLRSNVETLLLNMPTDTLKDTLDETQDKSLRLRQALLAKGGRVKMKTKHRDAHVYVFPKWVKQFAAVNESFDSISEDLVGWWAKAGWQTGLSTKLDLENITAPTTIARMEDSQSLEEEVDLYALSSTRSTKQTETTKFATRTGLSTQLAKDSTTVPPIHVYVQPSLPAVVVDPTKPATIPDTLQQPLIRRIDTSLALLNVSLYLAKQALPHPLAYEHKVHPTAQVGTQARVSEADSLVAENVTIGIRANIKESIIGANCEIGPNARLTRCLLMDGVTIGDGVQLTGCIVGRRAKIEGAEAHTTDPAIPTASTPKSKGKKKKGDDDDDKTRLTDCEVAPGFVVEVGTQSKGEKMMAFDADANLDDLGEEEDEDDDLDDEEL